MTEVLLRTLALSGATAVLATLTGGALAWAVVRTDAPGMRGLARWLSLPYALPPYLLALAWVVLGNPRVGMLRDFLPAQGSYGFLGMLCVLTAVAVAYPFLEIRAALERMDPALEESARIAGAGPSVLLRTITLPLLAPVALNGAVLAFLFALASFGVPAILGLPVREPVLTTWIYSELKVGGMAGLWRGVGYSAGLMGVAIVVLGLKRLGLRLLGARQASLMTGKASRASRLNLGRWGWALTGLAVAYLVLSTVLPWVALGLSALAPRAGDWSRAHWTLRNLKGVLSMADFWLALRNSVVLTAASASAVVVLGFVLGFFAERRKSRVARGMIQVSQLVFSLPGTVPALALLVLMSFLGTSPASALFWIGVAYVTKYLALASQGFREAFAQVDPVLEEAARLSGARGWELAWDLWFPLLRSSVVGFWVLAALPMATELTMSVLLTGPGAATLGTLLFELQEYADQPSAAALGWGLLTLAIGLTVFSGRKA